MKKSYQPPISIDKQIENLVSLGLEIKDTSYAKDVLNRVSYYRLIKACLLYTSPSPRDVEESRMPSSA